MSAACDTCPYRRSTPVGIWSPEEYRDLQRQDGHDFGSTFGCHKDKTAKTPCRGWLADQKRRGVPSIALRLRLTLNAEALAEFKSIDENDPDLYGSIAEMVRANKGQRFPRRSEKARRLAVKIAAPHNADAATWEE